MGYPASYSVLIAAYLLQAVYGRTAKLWKVKKKGLQEQQTFEHNKKVNAVAFSPNSDTLATATGDGKIRFFNIKTGQLQRSYRASKKQIYSIAFDTNGTRLVSAASDGDTRLWDLNDNPPTLLQTFPKAQGKIMDTTISPDGQWIASVGRDQIVHIYAVDGTTEKHRSFIGHENSIFRAIFSPDSHQIATVSADNTVRIWDLENGNVLFIHSPAILEQDIRDFDFRCIPENCWIVVPLYSFPKLVLYELGAIYD